MHVMLQIWRARELRRRQLLAGAAGLLVLDWWCCTWRTLVLLEEEEGMVPLVESIGILEEEVTLKLGTLQEIGVRGHQQWGQQQ